MTHYKLVVNKLKRKEGNGFRMKGFQMGKEKKKFNEH